MTVEQRAREIRDAVDADWHRGYDEFLYLVAARVRAAVAEERAEGVEIHDAALAAIRARRTP